MEYLFFLLIVYFSRFIHINYAGTMQVYILLPKIYLHNVKYKIVPC